jgi:hypothetical protein
MTFLKKRSSFDSIGPDTSGTLKRKISLRVKHQKEKSLWGYVSLSVFEMSDSKPLTMNGFINKTVGGSVGFGRIVALLNVVVASAMIVKQKHRGVNAFLNLLITIFIAWAAYRYDVVAQITGVVSVAMWTAALIMAKKPVHKKEGLDMDY